MTIDELEIYLKRKIKRVRRNNENFEDYSSNTHNFHGGWHKGYYEGKRSVLEDILEMIEDEKASLEKNGLEIRIESAIGDMERPPTVEYVGRRSNIDK